MLKAIKKLLSTWTNRYTDPYDYHIRAALTGFEIHWILDRSAQMYASANARVRRGTEEFLLATGPAKLDAFARLVESKEHMAEMTKSLLDAMAQVEALSARRRELARNASEVSAARETALFAHLRRLDMAY